MSTSPITLFGILKGSVTSFAITSSASREQLLEDGSEFVVVLRVGIPDAPYQHVAASSPTAGAVSSASTSVLLADTPLSSDTGATSAVHALHAAHQTHPFVANLASFNDSDHSAFVPLIVRAELDAQDPDNAFALSNLRAEVSVLVQRVGTSTLIFRQNVALLPILQLGARGMVASLHIEVLPTNIANPPPAAQPASISTASSIIGTLDFALSFHDLKQCVERLVIPVVDGGAPCRLISVVKETDAAIRGVGYGSIPLDEVYGACVAFFDVQCGAKPPRSSKAVAQLFAEPPHNRRWESLHDFDLGRCIVGDSGLLPVLATLQLCKCLRRLALDQNSLTLVSTKRLFAVLHDRRTLQELSLRSNEFYEAAGEELLRLIRVNRRIVTCDVSSNSFTPYLMKRFAKHAESNRKETEDNVFFVTSPQYDYLVNEESVPPAAWKHVLATWAMLTARPIAAQGPSSLPSSTDNNTSSGDVERSLFASSDAAHVTDQVEAATGKSRLEPTVPLVVTAPLFTLVLRTVEKHMRTIYEDPAVLLVFSDVAGTVEAATDALSRGTMYPVSFAKMLTVPLRTMVAYPHRFRDAALVIQGLGRAQAAIGVCPHHYAAASKLFIDSLTSHIGPDIMTAEARAAWCIVLALFVRHALTGTDAIAASADQVLLPPHYQQA